MRMISWNVNGFRACLKKGFADFFGEIDSDIFCVQETKMQEGQSDFSPEGYYQYYNSARKKGYSGTAVFTKIKPLSVTTGMEGKYDDEGRLITLEYDKFFLVNCYVPNSQPELVRLDYRMKFNDDLREYLCKLKEKKPVILCGDLNVAHKEIDLKNPASNIHNPGFTVEEREKMTELLSSGFVDTFRYLYPDLEGIYTWWSYRFNARSRNAGWRIDYFVVSEDIADRIKEATVYMDVQGSDHCPVGLEIDL